MRWFGGVSFQPPGSDISIDKLPLGSKWVAVPACMTEPRKPDIGAGEPAEGLGYRDQASARHDIRLGVKGGERIVHRLMNHFLNDHMPFASFLAEGLELTRVIVAEIVEFRMREGERRPHLRKLFRVAHAPDLGRFDHAG